MKSENFKTNKGVIEAWLNDYNDAGHNAKESIFFEGDTIYSYGYHFPLAYKANGGVVEITWKEKYSVTTSKHQIAVLDNAVDHFSGYVNTFKNRSENSSRVNQGRAHRTPGKGRVGRQLHCKKRQHYKIR